MENPNLYPFHEEASRLERNCKLPLHVGTAAFESHGELNHPMTQMFQRMRRLSGEQTPAQPEMPLTASFLVPASCNCTIFLQGPVAGQLSRNFGTGLTVKGTGPEGPFELKCQQYYVNSHSGSSQEIGWAIASPVNHLATITYGQPRPIAKVTAIINNFDFEYGNMRIDGKEPDQGEILRVVAAGRPVDFAWRHDRTQLRRLLDAEVLHCTALVTFSFAAWADATEEDLRSFAYHVASLCSIVAQQHTGVPVLSFFDSEGRVIMRILGNSIESEFRHKYIIRFLNSKTSGLAHLFAQCFDEHVRMQKSSLWRRLGPLCAAIEDPPYLEQKLATVMATVELLIRNSLLEEGSITPTEIDGMQLPGLIGAAKRVLGWDIPKHYTAKERHRLLRNAVAHGAPLPGDKSKARSDFDKWRLFLLRRLLIRLGYDGEVASPQEGFASTSAVTEFAERDNSFDMK